MNQPNYALAVAQLIKAAEELVESIGNDPLSYRSGVKRGNLIGALKAVAAVPRPEPVGFSPIHGKLYTEQPASAEPVNARLLSFVQEWLSRQGNDCNYMTEKARDTIAAAEQQQAQQELHTTPNSYLREEEIRLCREAIYADRELRGGK